MASVTERLEDVLERVAPQWGIRPVPESLRRLAALDLAVLWGDLSIGLLVLASGALLVPALGLPHALLAIALGSAVGSAPLALIGTAGAREGVPGMVLFRPVLGRRGSYLPSAANLVQLVGWTAFELWAMARVANAVSRDLFGLDAYLLWLGVVAVVCTALALAGPIFTIRRWLERFGVWVVAAVCVWITIRVLSLGGIGKLWSRPGEGGLPFWLAVDLVIAMPVSWLPLVADFNRFARDPRRSAIGTFWAYAGGNLWFYALGAMLVLAAGSTPDVFDIGTTIAAAAGGAVVLVVLLVGETDQAMANIYSGAVSVQNVMPRASQRALIVGVAASGSLIASLLRESAATTFQFFLLLIGSVFVPLFAVFLADWGVKHRGRYGEGALFDLAPPGVRWRAIVPWVAGFVIYQWCVPTGPGWWTDSVGHLFATVRLPFPLIAGSPLGASAPSFAVAFVLALLVLPRGPAATSTDRPYRQIG
ncbi:MAG: cytosine permease [Actinomycetota bacterium]|nr:cytosine permease [Actinomycetota bacterium]